MPAGPGRDPVKAMQRLLRLLATLDEVSGGRAGVNVLLISQCRPEMKIAKNTKHDKGKCHDVSADHPLSMLIDAAALDRHKSHRNYRPPRGCQNAKCVTEVGWLAEACQPESSQAADEYSKDVQSARPPMNLEMPLPQSRP